MKHQPESGREELKPFFEDWEIKLLELMEEHRNEEKKKEISTKN